MNEVIEMDGGWVRKIPHVDKEKLERAGELMLVMAATEKARQLLGSGEYGVDEDREQEEEQIFKKAMAITMCLFYFLDYLYNSSWLISILPHPSWFTLINSTIQVLMAINKDFLYLFK